MPPPTNTPTNTPVPPTDTPTPTNTPLPPTDTPTPTNTPLPPTDTPTATPQPSCGSTPGQLTIAKTASTYTARQGDPISFTICIINNSGGTVLLTDVTDQFLDTWFWSTSAAKCTFTSSRTRTDLDCSAPPFDRGGPPVIWQNPDLVNPVTLLDGDRIDLIVNGFYQNLSPPISMCNRRGADYNVTIQSGPAPVYDPVDPCVAIQP
ncbi:MAG: hypothetical protein IPO81_20995 [Kouleothrix sp.]|nr:hypothetical protein [Kouleothrix sp.]